MHSHSVDIYGGSATISVKIGEKPHEKVGCLLCLLLNYVVYRIAVNLMCAKFDGNATRCSRRNFGGFYFSGHQNVSHTPSPALAGRFLHLRALCV